jgi:hypothetical protein
MKVKTHYAITKVQAQISRVGFSVIQTIPGADYQHRQIGGACVVVVVER